MVLQEFNSEPGIPMYSARPEQAVQALKHVYNAALKKPKGKELELLLVILPDNNGALYGEDAVSPPIVQYFVANIFQSSARPFCFSHI